MNSHFLYKNAFNHAVDKANSCNCDVGIQKAREFGSTVYNVFLLPKPENRYGHELTCEVVRPGTPKAE